MLTAAHRIYGPGHNSCTVDERGRDMLVYHARDDATIKGDPLLDPDRHPRVPRIVCRAPVFDPPVANGLLRP